MPQIKRYTRQAMPQELINVQANSASFGGNTAGLEAQARALQESAQQTQQLGQFVEEYSLKRDKSKYIEQLSKFELENAKAKQELSTAEFEDGASLQNIYTQNLQERAAQLNIPNSMRDQFQADLGNMSLSFGKAGIQEQARREGVAATTEFENTLQSWSNLVALNPERKNEAIGYIKEQVSTLPIAPEDREAIAQSSYDKIRAAGADAMIEKNPYQFDTMLKNGQFDDLPNIETYIKKSNTRKKALKAEQDRVVTKAKASIKSIKERMTEGYGIPNTELEQVRSLAQQSGDMDTINSLIVLENINAYTSELKKLNPIELQNIINSDILPATQKDGATEPELLLLEQAEKTLSKMKSGLEKDPISYAASVGVPVDPFDPANPETITNRISTAVSVAQKYNTDIKPLTDEEADGLANTMKQSSIDEQLGFIKNVASVGRDGNYVFKSLGDKDNVLSYTGGLVTTDPTKTTVARTILTGKKSLEENPDLKPSQGAINAAFFGFTQDAFKGMPKHEAALKDAAVAHYVGSGKFKADKSGIMGLEIDTDDFEQSIKAVMGSEDGVISRNDQSFPLPLNISKGKFDDFLNIMDENDFLAFAVGNEGPKDSSGRDIKFKDIKKHGQFEVVDNGVYRIKIKEKYLLGDAPDGTFMMDFGGERINNYIQLRNK